jgi:DNA polymerase-3 subunit epsilon
MVLGLKKLLFGGGTQSPADLPPDVAAALAAWRASNPPALDDPHFLTRYVVLDIAVSGTRPDEDELLGITAVSVRAAAFSPADAFAFEIGGDADPAAVDRSLAAFLNFAAKAPLVVFHSPFVAGFLQRIYKERLGVDFQPRWIDLAWLLPSMFPEHAKKPVALDDWLEMFGIGSVGRRDTMDNTLVLARLFQKLLARANEKDILDADKLVEESQAATSLRRGS